MLCAQLYASSGSHLCWEEHRSPRALTGSNGGALFLCLLPCRTCFLHTWVVALNPHGSGNHKVTKLACRSSTLSLAWGKCLTPIPLLLFALRFRPCLILLSLSQGSCHEAGQLSQAVYPERQCQCGSTLKMQALNCNAHVTNITSYNCMGQYEFVLWCYHSGLFWIHL